MNYHWIPLIGKCDLIDDKVIFKGGTVEYSGGPGAAIGNIICDQSFGGGILYAEIKFSKISDKSSCELILFYDPKTKSFVTAGIGSAAMYAIRHFYTEWTYHDQTGDRSNLRADMIYKLRVTVKGSRVVLNVDGVNVISKDLPFTLPQGQVGIWCMDYNDIEISDFKIERETPKVFVVMQFSSPYNELYAEVIKKICEEMGLDCVRSDETYEPGLIITDIAKQIVEAKFIIAEITPRNPNVFYELGYAHAIRKPAILIAEKNNPLPFDVSGFRTLFYENSIAGKSAIENGLRKHIQAILDNW